MDLSSDPLQIATENCANEILKRLGNPKPGFLAVHFLSGKPKEPGYIRKSAVRIDEVGLMRIGLSSDPSEYKHSEVLQHHVRLFDRNDTLLLYALAQRAAPEIQPKPGDPKPYWLKIGQKWKKKDAEWHCDQIEWPKNIEPFLVPPDLAKQYFTAVYDGKGDLKQCLRDFERRRAESFGRWLSGKNYIGLDDESTWSTLKPLQSSLIYFRSFGMKDKSSRSAMSGDLLVIDVVDNPSGTMHPTVGIVVVSPCISSPALAKTIQDVVCQDFRAAVLIQLADLADLGGAVQKLRSRLGVPESTSEAIIFPVPWHKNRFDLATFWLTLLCQELSKPIHGIHEGDPLEFWFIAGDRSEFEDDPNIVFDKVFTGDLSEIVDFCPPRTAVSASKLQKSLANAVKRLAKEHFPWFERGRHALFFDISNDRVAAVGLVGIKGSNWSQFLSEVYKPATEQQVQIPACAVGFVSGEHGGGLALCHPQAEEGNPKLKILFRLRRGDVKTAADQRRSALDELFGQAVPDCDVELRQTVTELCLLIADDPHIGGTVVLLSEEDAFSRFVPMGKPWGFANAQSDKIPLMAHDGATLIYLGNGNQRWGYRYMLVPDGVDENIRKKLVGLADKYEVESPLAGVGTRRWSAALAAFSKGVRLVVAISQDGDITCWDCPDPKDFQTASILKLRLGETPSRIWMRDL